MLGAWNCGKCFKGLFRPMPRGKQLGVLQSAEQIQTLKQKMKVDESRWER